MTKKFLSREGTALLAAPRPVSPVCPASGRHEKRTFSDSASYAFKSSATFVEEV